MSFLLMLLSLNSFAAENLVEGKISKIVPAKTEIYVKSADGKTHEYYFNKNTQVVKSGAKVEFSELKMDQKVKVIADKKGKRLDPKTVEILE